MPEWLVEHGIGETRAALVNEGEILEARIELEGTVPAGSLLQARLTSVGSDGRNAVALSLEGTSYLLPHGARGFAEGALITIEVTREAIAGAEPWKRPLAKLAEGEPKTAPPLDQRLGGRTLVFPGATDELADAGWDGLIEQARSGQVMFDRGELRISPTPAMTLIDVDGNLPPEKLAQIGASEAGRAIRRLDIGGSIGIDLPTSGSKAARHSAAAAIDAVVPQPFERTAVNGFGFVQLVRPRTRASLIELAQDRPGFEARALLRRAAFAPPGAKRLVAHPSVVAELERNKTWTDRLSVQIGGLVELRANAGLPMSGGYAETL